VLVGRINKGRVILCGIIAGIVIDVVEGILNGVILSQRWTDAMTALGKPALSGSQVVAFNVYGLILGLAVAWTYAGFRPRFGANHKTAIYAALTVWVSGYLTADWAFVIAGVLPGGLVATLIIVGFFEIIVASVIGNYFYKEEAA
jgi:hypothetical protein